MTARDTRTVRIPVELFDRITALAEQQTRSTTQQVIHLLRLALKESGSESKEG